MKRIRDQWRGVCDVCEDPDLPTLGSLGDYIKRRPDFEENLRRAYYSLPYNLQVKYHQISPQLTVDCRRLLAQGMHLSLIAETLEVPRITVQKLLKNAGEEPARLKQAAPRKGIAWKREDYEALLERMRKQQRALSDVGREPGLPSYEVFRRYKKKHPDLAEKAREIYYGFPYSMQMKHSEISPRFLVDCKRLYTRGIPMIRVARALGVGITFVRRALKSTGDL